jgi:HlyD family secretion protein
VDEQDFMIIRPGMSVRADIYTQSSEETLAVPVQAVLYDEDSAEDEKVKDNKDKTYVFVLEDGKAVRKDVEVGISSDSDQEIIKGLEQGETVITGPFRVLRDLEDGDSVEEKEAEKAEEDNSVTVEIGD